MCGRYGFDSPASLLAEQYPGLREVGDAIRGYNFSPGRRLSVVVGEPKGPVLRPMTWGLRSPRLRRPLVNVRAEGVSRHEVFAPLFAHSRCVVPATHFIEWLDDSEPRQPFVARSAHGAFGLAGLYSEGTFAILTTAATEPFRRLHGRMPVVLGVPSFAAWLDPQLVDAARLRAAARPLRSDLLSLTLASTELNDARKNGPSLLQALAPSRPLVRQASRADRH